MFFNAGCNDHKYFFLNPEKKIAQIRLGVFEKNTKKNAKTANSDALQFLLKKPKAI